MLDLIIGLRCLPYLTGRRVSVVGGGGAITVAASDALERAGLSMPPFSSKIVKAIREHLPPSGNSTANPVDIGSPLFEPKSLRGILEAVAASDTVDLVIVEHMVFKFMSGFSEELANVVPSVSESTGIPFVVTLPHTSTGTDALDVEQTRRRYREWYLARNIPVFDSTRRAANVLKKVVRYNEFVGRAG
jgi:acyl-CoA synthetase (NDP forming)